MLQVGLPQICTQLHLGAMVGGLIRMATSLQKLHVLNGTTGCPISSSTKIEIYSSVEFNGQVLLRHMWV